MKYKIFNEDCVDTMQRMIRVGYSEVDTILTSPPYNNSRAIHTTAAMENHWSRYDSYNDNMTNDEYSAWTIKLFNMFDKILLMLHINEYLIKLYDHRIRILFLIIFLSSKT